MKEKIINELKSFFISFIAVFAVEAFAQLVMIYNGHFEWAIFEALGFAALRSSVKVMLQLFFPKLFPILTNPDDRNSSQQ